MSPKYLDIKQVSAPIPPPDPMDLELQNVYLRAEVLDLKGDRDAIVKAVQGYAKTLVGSDRGRRARSMALLQALGYAWIDWEWNPPGAVDAVRWIVEGVSPGAPADKILVWGPLPRDLMEEFLGLDEDEDDGYDDDGDAENDPLKTLAPTAEPGQGDPVGCLYGDRVGRCCVVFQEDRVHIYVALMNTGLNIRAYTYGALRVDLGTPRKAVWLQDPTCDGYEEAIKEALKLLGLGDVRVPDVARTHLTCTTPLSLIGYPTDWS